MGSRDVMTIEEGRINQSDPSFNPDGIVLYESGGDNATYGFMNYYFLCKKTDDVYALEKWGSNLEEGEYYYHMLDKSRLPDERVEEVREIISALL